jgi:hypothetical protein
VCRAGVWKLSVLQWHMSNLIPGWRWRLVFGPKILQ